MEGGPEIEELLLDTVKQRTDLLRAHGICRNALREPDAQIVQRILKIGAPASEFRLDVGRSMEVRLALELLGEEVGDRPSNGRRPGQPRRNRFHWRLPHRRIRVRDLDALTPPQRKQRRPGRPPREGQGEEAVVSKSCLQTYLSNRLWEIFILLRDIDSILKLPSEF